MSKSEVHVQFIDASTGKVFAETFMPAKDIPSSFEPETTVNISGQDWQVVKAEPLTAEEYTQMGKLALTLAKVSTVPPQDILFSLPTICDEIPVLVEGSTKQGKNVFEIHEDDWRQIEFVASCYHSTIESELTEIARVWQDEKVDLSSEHRAFRNIYVRRQITVPVAEEITLDQILAIFPSTCQVYDGIAYLGADGIIEGGFAFGLSPVTFYGQQAKGVIKVLGLDREREGVVEISDDVVTAFSTVMSAHNLYLVDWCRLAAFASGEEDVKRYLEGLL